MDQIKRDIHPLCPEHLDDTMLYGEETVAFGNEMQSRERYFCKLHPECRYRYDIVLGYFEVGEDRRPQKALAFKKKCSVHGRPMYLSEIEPQENKRIWHCACVGCDCQIVEGTRTT